MRRGPNGDQPFAVVMRVILVAAPRLSFDREGRRSSTITRTLTFESTPLGPNRIPPVLHPPELRPPAPHVARKLRQV